MQDIYTTVPSKDLTMRDFVHLEGAVSTDTYLGARMNQKSLNFHTQLHDWSEAQKLSALASKHSLLLNSAKTGEVYLPIKKLADIEYWTKQVNRYFNPNKHCRPKSGSFMKIDVSKFNMKVDKNEERSKSAIYPRRPFSSVSRLTTGVQSRRRFFGNDVHTVNNKLIESQMHYSAQRRNIYSATKKSTKSAKTDDQKSEIIENDVSELNDDQEAENKSETITVEENTSSSKVDSHESQGQCFRDKKVMQPQIVARSWSNRELNVISIDDCKLTCRYRPQIIKENHKIPDDLDAMQKARSNRTKHENSSKDKDTQVKVTEAIKEHINGNEADDEAENSEDNTDATNNAVKITDSVTVDTNNNRTAQTCLKESDNRDSQIENGIKTETPGGKDETENKNETKETSASSISSEDNDMDNIKHHYVNRNGFLQQDEEEQNGSQGAGKTSYGRLTTLYTSSHSSKYMTKEEKDQKKRKKPTRTSRINYAINDMIRERRVMNSLERDFDTRTAQYGRTVVEKTEGSETFKKIHANLRKKIDAFVDTHSAVKTKEFYLRSRTNSATNSVHET